MDVYIHNRTGDKYLIFDRIKIKIPVVGIWVGFVKYRSIKGDCFFYRLQSDFDKKFTKTGDNVRVARYS